MGPLDRFIEEWQKKRATGDWRGTSSRIMVLSGMI